MTDDTLTWERLEEVRAMLARRAPCSISEFDAFCVSVTSPDDVGVLREIVLRSPVRTAAFAAFNLLWFAGFGDIADLLRVRLRSISGEFMNDMDETVPALMLKCAKELFDVSAVRFLYEFQHRPSFAEEFAQLATVGSLPIPQCFLWTRQEQISRFLAEIGREYLTDDESMRCRNFVDDDRVFDLLVREVDRGSLTALSSLLFKEGVVSWDLFGLVRPADDRQRNILRNLTFENLKRGASRQDIAKYSGSDTPFGGVIEGLIAHELLDGEPLYF